MEREKDDYKQTLHAIRKEYKKAEEKLLKEQQAKIDRCFREFEADSKRYTRVASSSGKDLTKLHQFRRGQYREHLAFLKQESEDLLTVAIKRRDEGIRAMRRVTVRARQQIHARFLARQRKRQEQQQQLDAARSRLAKEFPLKAEYRFGEESGMTPEARTATIGPVCMPESDATAVERIRSTDVDNSTPRIVSSDGSLINLGTDRVAMAFGVVDISHDEIYQAQGRTDGYASSAKAELMGLIGAVLAAPPEQDIVVELDSLDVVRKYQEQVANRCDTLPRKRLRCNYAGLWATLHRLVCDRAGTVNVKWIRGHRHNQGNIMADAVATQAARTETAPWRVDLSVQTDITHFAHFQGQLVETDLRQLLKQQSVIRHHQAWTSQRHTKSAIADLDDVEWRSTLAHVHDKKPVHTFFSSRKDTRRRTQRIKALYGMLPTMNTMQARHPNLYSDCICRVCGTSEEDNRHVWECGALTDVHQEIWHSALGKIDVWGAQATSAYKKLYPESDATWRCPTSSANIQGLSVIAGTRAVLIDDDEPDIADDLKWRISDLYRGITPCSLIQHWSTFFSTPAAIARTVIHKFVRYLADQAFEMIWKPRCKTTIAWELQQGITPARKRVAYNGPAKDWDAGYGFKFGPNHCPCSRLLTDHVDGQCPGPVRDPFEADHTLLECWLGRQHRTIMGGVGKIPFL